MQNNQNYTESQGDESITQYFQNTEDNNMSLVQQQFPILSQFNQFHKEILDISQIHHKSLNKSTIICHQELKKKQHPNQYDFFKRQNICKTNSIYLQKVETQTIIPHINYNFKLSSIQNDFIIETEQKPIQRQINLGIRIILNRIKKLIFVFYSQLFIKKLKNISRKENNTVQVKIKTQNVRERQLKIGIEMIRKVLQLKIMIQRAYFFSILQLNSKAHFQIQFVSIFLLTLRNMMKKLKLRLTLCAFTKIKQIYHEDIQQMKKMKKLFQNSKKYLQEKWPKLKSIDKDTKFKQEGI